MRHHFAWGKLNRAQKLFCVGNVCEILFAVCGLQFQLVSIANQPAPLLIQLAHPAVDAESALIICGYSPHPLLSPVATYLVQGTTTKRCGCRAGSLHGLPLHINGRNDVSKNLALTIERRMHFALEKRGEI